MYVNYGNADGLWYTNALTDLSHGLELHIAMLSVTKSIEPHIMCQKNCHKSKSNHRPQTRPVSSCKFTKWPPPPTSLPPTTIGKHPNNPCMTGQHCLCQLQFEATLVATKIPCKGWMTCQHEWDADVAPNTQFMGSQCPPQTPLHLPSSEPVRMMGSSGWKATAAMFWAWPSRVWTQVLFCRENREPWQQFYGIYTHHIIMAKAVTWNTHSAVIQNTCSPYCHCKSRCSSIYK